jgi:hypothetical protein
MIGLFVLGNLDVKNPNGHALILNPDTSAGTSGFQSESPPK